MAAWEATTLLAAGTTRKQPWVRGMGKNAAINLFCPNFLFEGEGEDGEEMIHSVPEVNLNCAYLPLAPDTAVSEYCHCIYHAGQETEGGLRV